MAWKDHLSWPVLTLPRAITKYPGGEQLQFYLRYAPTFKGRATRSEFFGTFLTVLLLCFALSVVGPLRFLMERAPDIREADPRLDIDLAMTLFVFALPMSSVVVRRLHDTNRHWWAIFVIVFPYIGWLILFGILMLNPDPEENQFGHPPT
ncbi:MAG: DUF805 domain-containing protein [Pseudomonadota bacterium]